MVAALGQWGVVAVQPMRLCTKRDTATAPSSLSICPPVRQNAANP